MPRSSGTYTPPAGNPVVAGTVISSAVQNNTINDIGNELTNSLPRDGTAPPTANIPMGNFKITGLGAATLTTDVPQYQQVQSGSSMYLTAVAGTNTITGTLSSPTLAAYAAGNTFRFTAAGANTGAVTLNINGLGAKAITKSGTGALSSGDINSGATVEVIYDGTQFQLVSVQATAIQAQTNTSFTTGGTPTAYTLTPSPALPSLITNHRFNVTFNATAGATPTLAISGLTAKNLKYYDSTGTKQAVTSSQIVANLISDVVYDGTDYVVINPATSASVTALPAVRQTILSGTVDTSGLPSFGGSTGSTTVTTSTTLVATAANGTANRTGSITNASWTGLSTNGTMYLYLDIDSAGVCTTGSTTLQPNYRWGGADVVTNLQNTFNIQEMQMKVGNGATASQVSRVFVGEVTVAGAVVTVITWYALMGRYVSPDQAVPANGTAIAVSHNLGINTPYINVNATLKNTTGEGNYVTGDAIPFGIVDNGANAIASYVARLNSQINGNYTLIGVANKTTAARFAITPANWRFVFNVTRGF